MSDSLQDWPAPDETARSHSVELTRRIREVVENNGGRISFARFMEMALYEPGLGYYSGGARKFGAGGDFVTAPEISPLFSACLARQCEQVFDITGAADILELGAGSGVMARDLLDELDRRGALPDRYFILETSAELKARQQTFLQETLPAYYERVHWLETLPAAPINGVILANEVLDALPVNRLRVTGGEISEWMVGMQGDSFTWQPATTEPEWLSRAVDALSPCLPDLPEGYVTEFNPRLDPFIHSLADALDAGAVLLIDYGYPRAEYYHRQRHEGTLVCHYRHRRHSDPFVHIGLQDITASVDFTLVAESGAASGLNVAGFASQAAFLIGAGLEEVLAERAAGGGTSALRQSREAGQLVLPGQMGEHFKAIAFTRHLDTPLKGFAFSNHVHRL